MHMQQLQRVMAQQSRSRGSGENLMTALQFDGASALCRSGNGASPSSALRLDMAAALLPHPQKADRGGEDAVFLGDDSLSFGEHTHLMRFPAPRTARSH